MLKKSPLLVLLPFLLGVAGPACDLRRDKEQSPKESIYTGLTNQDLKLQASKLVTRLQNFRQETEREDRERERRFDQKWEAAQSENEKQAVAEEHSREIRESIGQQSQKFQREFVGEVRALSAELRTRLPAAQTQQADDVTMEIILRSGQLVGANPLRNVIDNLEKLITLLPSTPERSSSLPERPRPP